MHQGDRQFLAELFIVKLFGALSAIAVQIGAEMLKFCMVG
jgi:hypothetical protein